MGGTAFDIYDLVGLVGAFFSIYSYARVQWRREYAKEINYSLFNVLSSTLVGISFLKHWNVSSFVINSFWGVISVYGVYRCLKYVRRGKIIEVRLKKRARSKS